MHVAYTGSFSDPSLMSKQAAQFVARVRSGKLGGVSYRITLKNGGEKIKFNKAANTPLRFQTAAQKVIARIVSGKIVIPSGQ